MKDYFFFKWRNEMKIGEKEQVLVDDINDEIDNCCPYMLGVWVVFGVLIVVNVVFAFFS